MSASERQNRLVVAEDWKKIYQSFRNADFQSYDFDNLRRAMINYMRQNYPEDFNDYIESSEFMSLIDMVAFLGQNLSFRIDLNARENFLDTAERRESVLRLARMLAYNPRRNQPASGLMRIDSIQTTENLLDSTGLNLSGVTVKWNDRANDQYYEQYVKIMNSAMPPGSNIGNPIKAANINGVLTQKYRFNALNLSSAVFPFSKSINGVRTQFEVVSTDIMGDSIREEPPVRGTSPAFLFRDDGQGATSSNTGFFMHFRQGTLQSSNFSIDRPIPNQVVSVETENINDSDVWLYGVDSNGIESTPWNKLDSTEGNNIIYNSLFSGIRNVYSVTTRSNDRINFVFSDGVFGNLPSGNFKAMYRTSASNPMSISPGAMGTISIEVPYQSVRGTIETLTLGLRLQYTVNNGSSAETNDEIRKNAPASYYTQNRLITGEDYNIGTLSLSQEIIKSKSVNRSSSGISKYFELKDPTGKYSNTSVFADDGIIYQDFFLTQSQKQFSSQSDIEGFIYNFIEGEIASTTVNNFYWSKFSYVDVSSSEYSWENRNYGDRVNLGSLMLNDEYQTLSSFTDGELNYVEIGAYCRFTAPDGYSFSKTDQLISGSPPGSRKYLWAVVETIVDFVLEEQPAGTMVTLSKTIPDGSILSDVMPKYAEEIDFDAKVQIIDRAFVNQDFGLRYDQEKRRWSVITSENLDVRSEWSLDNTGDTTGENLDSSWIFRFKSDGERYTITHRNLRYVFESAGEIRFFFDNADRIYDPQTGRLFFDSITVLGINELDTVSSQPLNRDIVWSISDTYRDSEEYVNTRKIEVGFSETRTTAYLDDPELFESLVGVDDFVFQKRHSTDDGDEFAPFDRDSVLIHTGSDDPTGLESGQVIYYRDFDAFKIYTGEEYTVTFDYRANRGRDGLKFHYVHVADSNYRIDPGVSNLIDTYFLTRSYDNEMRKYARGEIADQPLPPSSDQLFREYDQQLSRIKSISDEVIYHPVKYKLLFGDRAQSDLQVSFKIVRNKNVVMNVNELKSDIVRLLNEYFDVENWDFGETFYFQELSAFIMNKLSPKLVSLLIVPRQPTQAFGSLFEIKSSVDEVFLSAATVQDVEIIDEITASNIRASGEVITTVTASESQLLSSAPSQTP